MRVVFRADASASLGYGHVLRCLTLGAALVDRGVLVAIASRSMPTLLTDRARARGIAVLPLPVRNTQPDEPEAADPQWQSDAEESRDAISTWGGSADWVVVDTYALDCGWEEALRSSARHVMVIDDLANRMHACEVLLDQNLVTDIGVRYGALVPDECDRLLGPQWALLEPVYAESRARARIRSGVVRRVLGFFGGADRHNLAGRTAGAFARLSRADVTLDVVTVAEHPGRAQLEHLVRDHDNIVLHGHQRTLAPLMLEADVAIGAAGSTSWERLCLGLPALVVTLADNQAPIAAELDRLGLACSLGPAEQCDEARVTEALRQILDVPLDADWSARCFAAVDGLGAARVAEHLLSVGYATSSTRRSGVRHTRPQ